MAGTPTIEIRRSGSRFLMEVPWLHSRHSFSFGPHYDAENVGFGLLLVSNDDIIQPGTGFRTHPHQDMEIVTWVLEGELEHEDSQGNRGMVYPGLAQRMSAGSGIWHSEMNPASEVPVRLVQMWVLPDTERVQPGYAQLNINRDLGRGALVPVASGRGHDAAISIRQREAVLLAGRLRPNEAVRLPDAPYLHLYVARARVELEGAGWLEEGDAVRLAGAGGPLITAGEAGAEVIAWRCTRAYWAASALPRRVCLHRGGGVAPNRSAVYDGTGPGNAGLTS